MSCSFSREALALHAEGDLSQPYAEITSSHVASCEECRQFLEQLRASQLQLKSLRRELVDSAECASLRREVMAKINQRQTSPSWVLEVERGLILGFRRHAYGLAAVVVVGVLSASVVAQMRLASSQTSEAARFDGWNTLIRPEGYRDWISVGASRKVYINPSGYRAYARTGAFPEGTLLVWEASDAETTENGASSNGSERAHPRSSVLLASVKDSTRFAGGWGFFDFTGIEGALKTKATALPESSGCRTCHRRT